MTRNTIALGLLAAFAFTAPTLAQAAQEQFKATLTTASEVPPKTTDGKGAATATLDTATKKLTYNVTYSGLTGPATAAHIHGPAAVGKNAGVLVPLTPVATPIAGTVTLTDAQIADLEAGNTYINVHTAANPGGEIRGQLTK